MAALSTLRTLAIFEADAAAAAQIESSSSRKSAYFFPRFSAKSTELLHSPPVYESDIDAPVDHDFYDYAVPVQDDDFYYVSWEDPIYDVLYDYTGNVPKVTRFQSVSSCFCSRYWAFGFSSAKAS